jgi:hypothetical protein
MKVLKSEALPLISGGVAGAVVAVSEAALAGVGVYSAPHVIYESTLFLNDIGRFVGEWTFEITHPNVLGQMEFSASDLGMSYIAPSFSDSYFN